MYQVFIHKYLNIQWKYTKFVELLFELSFFSCVSYITHNLRGIMVRRRLPPKRRPQLCRNIVLGR